MQGMRRPWLSWEGRPADRPTKWKYMLSEVRPHELYTIIWTMFEAESKGFVGEMESTNGSI